MTIIRTLWYLAGLFAFAGALTSAITVAPGGEVAIAIVITILLSLAFLIVLGTLLLSAYHRRKPDARVFTSKALSRVVVTVAVFLTLIVLLGVVG
nr:putative integron gene cassette protein [uncultured bacterium]CAP47832.1 putative integron gene cassette protein [uncultured bacterium]